MLDSNQLPTAFNAFVFAASILNLVPTSRIERLSTVLQTAAMTTSAKLVKILAEAVRFELTEHFYSSVFKTGAINRTLPHFQDYHIETHYIQPKVIFANATHTSKPAIMCFNMVGDTGFEPVNAGIKIQCLT